MRSTLIVGSIRAAVLRATRRSVMRPHTPEKPIISKIFSLKPVWTPEQAQKWRRLLKKLKRAILGLRWEMLVRLIRYRGNDRI